MEERAMASWFTHRMLAALNDKRTHNPYQKKRELGPGPKGGWNRTGQPFKGGERTASTGKTDRFDCLCRRGTCTCLDRETGKRTQVGKPLNQRSKAQYNKVYKAWRKTQAKEKE